MAYYDYGNPNMGYSQGYNQGYSQARTVNQPQVENTFAWVYGDAGAKAFPVAPGKTVVLMDNERPIMYLKSTDMSGRPLPLEVYELVKVTEQSQAPMPQWSGNTMHPQISQNSTDMNEYVKKADLESEVTKIMHQQSMGGMMNGQPNS